MDDVIAKEFGKKAVLGSLAFSCIKALGVYVCRGYTTFF